MSVHLLNSASAESRSAWLPMTGTASQSAPSGDAAATYEAPGCIVSPTALPGVFITQVPSGFHRIALPGLGHYVQSNDIGAEFVCVKPLPMGQLSSFDYVPLDFFNAKEWTTFVLSQVDSCNDMFTSGEKNYYFTKMDVWCKKQDLIDFVNNNYTVMGEILDLMKRISLCVQCQIILSNERNSAMIWKV